LGYKVRWGTARIYADKDTELPDGAFNHVCMSYGPKESDIGFMYPVDEESKKAVAISEILHHILGDYK
jgi:hypothetical protein